MVSYLSDTGRPGNAFAVASCYDDMRLDQKQMQLAQREEKDRLDQEAKREQEDRLVQKAHERDRRNEAKRKRDRQNQAAKLEQDAAKKDADKNQAVETRSTRSANMLAAKRAKVPPLTQ
jgi:hypothetical protein